MSFLPSWPLNVDQLLLFSLLLLVGLAGGELAQRFLRLPRIVGYVLAGALIGKLHQESIHGAFGESLFDQTRGFAEIGLALVLFVMGRRLDFSWLRRDRWLLATGVAESAAAFGATYYVLTLFDIQPLWAAIAAAAAMSTSPAVVMLIVRDNQAEGQLTERILCLTALNGVFAVLGVTMLLSWLHLEYRAGLEAVLLHPLYLLGGSLLLAWIAAWLLMRAARYCGKRESVQFVLIVGAVLLTVALADMLQLSVLIALLAMGVVVQNFDTRRTVLNVEFGFAAEPFFILLFVIVGLRLPFTDMGEALLPALAFFAARVAAKGAAIFALGYAGGMSAKKSWLMGLALTPMSGVATILVSDTTALYPEFSHSLAAIVFGAIVLGDLLGPPATQYALRHGGETGDRA